jgi:FkbM family methyltransferase
MGTRKGATLAIRCRDVAFEVTSGPRDGFWRFVNAGEWEKTTFDTLDKLLVPGTCMIDIGTWIGPLTLYAAAKGCKVISVEADPLSVAELRSNIALNPDLASRITVIDKAVHPSGGKIAFGSMGAGNDSSSSFVHKAMMTRWIVNTVTPAEIASVAPKMGRVVVKMDIEGGEYLVIPAAHALWERADAALISFHPKFIERRPLRRVLTLHPLSRSAFETLSRFAATKVGPRRIVPRPDARLLGPLGLLGLYRPSVWLFERRR